MTGDTESSSEVRPEAGMSRRKRLTFASVATAITAVSISWQIAHRSGLSMDELHSVLLGQLWMQGDPPSFYVGSVTRYEGGSWLIGFPVSLLLRLGLWGTAATSWTAAGFALATVFLTAFWLTRVSGPVAAVGLGVGAAFLSPELLHYSYRAWGSLSEALLILPLLALSLSAWNRGGRPLWGLPLVGLLLAVGVVLSYFHMVTSVLVCVLLAVEGFREGQLRAGLGRAFGVGVSLLLGFASWVVLLADHPLETLSVRDGRSLWSTVSDLLLVRIDKVFLHLPGAWVGEHLEATSLRLFGGGGLAFLSCAAAVVLWRRGGESRWLSMYFAVCFPALSVGHSILEAPDVYRYYMPLLASSVALIAAWGWRPLLLALLLAATFWFPGGMEMPGQKPTRAHMELGGNALHRYAENPHIKYETFRSAVRPAYQDWFAFGYGLDCGLRFSRTVDGMLRMVEHTGTTVVEVVANPQMTLYETRAWIQVEGEPEGDYRYFLRGFGVALLADGRVDGLEGELLATATWQERSELLIGMGAVVGRHYAGGGPPGNWLEGLVVPLGVEEWEALGRGMAFVGAGGSGAVVPVSLARDSVASAALKRGLQVVPDPQLVEMMNIPMVPTPTSIESFPSVPQ